MRADVLPDSLVGSSSFGVEGSAFPAAALTLFEAGFVGGAWLAGGAWFASGAGLAVFAAAVIAGIGVPSGRSDTVRTGFGSGNWDGAAGGAGAVITTTGVSTVCLMEAPDPPASAPRFAGLVGAVAEAAVRSTGCSSVVTTFTPAGLPLSFSKLASLSLEEATLSSLGGCTLVGPCAAAMNGTCFGKTGHGAFSAMTPAIIATPATASPATASIQVRDRHCAGAATRPAGV